MRAVVLYIFSGAENIDLCTTSSAITTEVDNLAMNISCVTLMTDERLRNIYMT